MKSILKKEKAESKLRQSLDSSLLTNNMVSRANFRHILPFVNRERESVKFLKIHWNLFNRTNESGTIERNKIKFPLVDGLKGMGKSRFTWECLTHLNSLENKQYHLEQAGVSPEHLESHVALLSDLTDNSKTLNLRADLACIRGYACDDPEPAIALELLYQGLKHELLQSGENEHLGENKFKNNLVQVKNLDLLTVTTFLFSFFQVDLMLVNIDEIDRLSKSGVTNILDAFAKLVQSHKVFLSVSGMQAAKVRVGASKSGATLKRIALPPLELVHVEEIIRVLVRDPSWTLVPNSLLSNFFEYVGGVPRHLEYSLGYIHDANDKSQPVDLNLFQNKLSEFCSESRIKF